MKVEIPIDDGDGGGTIHNVHIPKGWRVVPATDKKNRINFVMPYDKAFCSFKHRLVIDHDIVGCSVGNCHLVVRRIHRKK